MDSHLGNFGLLFALLDSQGLWRDMGPISSLPRFSSFCLFKKITHILMIANGY
jgi:hypothetical protein